MEFGVYLAILQKRFHKLAAIAQGGDDYCSSPCEVIIDVLTAMTSDNMLIVIPEHAIEVANDLKKINAYALNSYTCVV